MNDSSDLFRLKKKGGPSSSSSIRSGKSGYMKRATPSSNHSGTSTLVRDLISNVPEKDKQQAARLTNKIKEIKEAFQRKQVADIFEELEKPYNRALYYDSIDDERAKDIEDKRSKQLHKLANIVPIAIPLQKQEPEKKPDCVYKFQKRMNMLIISFRVLKRQYFPNDLYRTIRLIIMQNFENESMNMLKSAFLNSRLFIVSHIERLAFQESLKISTALQKTLSVNFFEIMMKQASGEFLGELQGKIFNTISALSRITEYRKILQPCYFKILEYYRNEQIYNSNILPFIKLFSELACYQDLDWRMFGLLDLYLELMERPIRKEHTAIEILERLSPDYLKDYVGNAEFKEEDFEMKKKEESKDEVASVISGKTLLNRQMTRLNSVSSLRRLNTRSGVLKQSGLLKNLELQSELERNERMQDMRRNLNMIQATKHKDRIAVIYELDKHKAEEIVIQASRGLSWLMLPNSNSSFLRNVGTLKETMYQEMLDRDMVNWIIKHPAMQENYGEVKRSLSTMLTFFVLQTTTESIYKGEHVIFYLKRQGILKIVTAWSKDPDLAIRANSAWIFAALCVHHLVPPVELTKLGIVRDMFVLFIKLYNEPSVEVMEPPEATNIAEKVLSMYNYDKFFDSLSGILNRSAKIQHLIFATLIFLSIYDDDDIISALNRAPDEDVDKPVEENALCGLMELLEKDTDKMKLFIKILIQFTICDDDSFQQNGIWYLKHIIINTKLNQLVEAQNVGILEVFIAGSVCESEIIQQECVNVLTYLAIEKKAYQDKEDPLLDALMYLTGVQFKRIRGLAYNGLAALALHGSYAVDILIKQAEIPDYFNTITRNLKRFRQQFVDTNYKSDTVAEYAGINLLLNLSRSATKAYQYQVSERVPLILDTIAAQNQLISDENMNEVGCLQTIRALMCSSTLDIKEKWVVPFLDRIAKDRSFRITKILINSKFITWCMNLLLESNTIEQSVLTSKLLRDVLHIFYHSMNFEQEETNIRELIRKLNKRYAWYPGNSSSNLVHETLVESSLLVFVREKNVVIAVSDEIVELIQQVIETFTQRAQNTKLALSKLLASTANLPQTHSLLLRKIPKTLEIIMYFLDSEIYEERVNATRLLVYITRSFEFDELAYSQDILRKLCNMLKQYVPQDLHSLVITIGNLLVFSRGKTDQNQFEWFMREGYFELLLQKTKENDCHSLSESFLELMTKLLVEKEFTDKMFVSKSTKSAVVRDLMYVLKRAVCHECEARCADLSSQDYLFSINCFSFTWLGLKRYGFAVSSQLVRLGYCHEKIKKYEFGKLALKWFQKGCKHMHSRRTIDPTAENLLNELCLFIQLNYGVLHDTELAESLMGLNKTMAAVIKHEKVTDLLQARMGALLLHSALTAPISEDSSKLADRITSVLFTMTNSSLPELHNLAVWSLRQLYLKTVNTNPEFSYKEIFLNCKAIKNVVPKLVEPHRPVQENALLCLASLFEYEPMKQEFLELSALPQLMFQGNSAYRGVQKGVEQDSVLLSSFGAALSQLVKDKFELQEYLCGEYQVMEFTIGVLNIAKHTRGETWITICQNFTKALHNLLENEKLHASFFNFKVENVEAIVLLKDLLHSDEVPTYEQLIVDHSVSECYALLANNSENKFYETARFSHFTAFVNQICQLYDKGDFLSRKEVETHTSVLNTLKELILLRFQKLPENLTDDDREEFLQELAEVGGLEPLLFFENSNVPEIRETATEVLNTLAPQVS